MLLDWRKFARSCYIIVEEANLLQSKEEGEIKFSWKIETMLIIILSPSLMRKITMIRFVVVVVVFDPINESHGQLTGIMIMNENSSLEVCSMFNCDHEQYKLSSSGNNYYNNEPTLYLNFYIAIITN